MNLQECITFQRVSKRMNNTNTTFFGYGTAATIVMPFAPALMCPAIAVITYLIAKRRLTAATESSTRSYVFVRMLSGNLFGEFISRIVYLCSIWLAMFCAIGYTIFNIAESVAYVWNTNSDYVSIGDEMPHEDMGLDKINMVHKTVIVLNDVKGEETRQTLEAVDDLWKIETKRVWILGCLIGLFTIMSVTDGLLLIYKPPDSLASIIISVVSYFLSCAALSSCVYGAMIHARIHSIESKRTRLFTWGIISAGWCIMLTCTLIPLLLNVSYETVASIVEYPALTAFYGVSLGVMLKIQVYFHSLRTTTRISRDNRIWGEIVFTLSAAQAILTGFFL